MSHEPLLELTMRLLSTVFVNDSKSIKTADLIQRYQRLVVNKKVLELDSK